MFCLALVCSGLLGIDPGPEGSRSTPASELSTYQSLRAKVGQDSPGHVKLALWCEAHGLDAERRKHLALAVLTDPRNATARGLLGLVAYRDHWVRPEQVCERIKADEALTAKLAAYNARREERARRLEPEARTSATLRTAAAAHYELGAWCRENGLEPEANAHFTSASVLDPYDSRAWYALGYADYNGRWMSAEQISAEKRQSQALDHWEPLFQRWRGWLAEPGRRKAALAHLNEVVNPEAAPAIRRVFRDGHEAHEQIAIGMLAKIDAPAATHGLAVLSVLGVTPSVRAAAIKILRTRAPRDYVGTLVDQIHTPMKYQVDAVRGPGSPGTLVVETPRFRTVRSYDAPEVARLGDFFLGGYLGYDGNGMPVIATWKDESRLQRDGISIQGMLDLAAIEQRTQALIAAANLKATASLQRMIDDVNAIEQSNAQATALNARIVESLQGAIDAPGLDPNDEDEWHRWWYDRVGYRYDPPSQVVTEVNASPQPPAPTLMSCFVAGTPVHTLDGLRPIETLRVGDQVLSQDTSSGALAFQIVTVVHHNPPSATVRLVLDNGETLVPSIYHRFWRAGDGWAMARDLRPGDILRTREGRARIVSVSSGPTEPVFNLDVAGSRTFFAGTSGALVHDNTLPTTPAAPFDALPALAAAMRF
jgi:hypothetical protein